MCNQERYMLLHDDMFIFCFLPIVASVLLGEGQLHHTIR